MAVATVEAKAAAGVETPVTTEIPMAADAAMIAETTMATEAAAGAEPPVTTEIPVAAKSAMAFKLHFSSAQRRFY